MSTYKTSRRLQFIIQLFHDKEFISKKSVIEYLERQDIFISTRTLERDFEKINSDFGIELKYDRNKKAYFIDNDKSVKVDSFIRFLELSSIADIFSNSVKNNKKIYDYISFDDSSSFSGIENLKTIILSLTQEKDISFEHINYHKKTNKNYTITPLLIKEYINRWYLIGVPNGQKEIRTFGVDRLSNIKTEQLTQIDKKKFYKKLKKFENVVGLNYSNKNIKKILFKVTDEHSKYLESLPIHKSQKISASKDKGFSIVSINVIPNYELTAELLKMSIQIEVLEPIEFREYFKQVLQTIYNKYN